MAGGGWCVVVVCGGWRVAGGEWQVAGWGLCVVVVCGGWGLAGGGWRVGGGVWWWWCEVGNGWGGWRVVMDGGSSTLPLPCAAEQYSL